MKTSQKGKIALAVSEGIADTAYKDTVGVWTIGIGHAETGPGLDPKKYIGKTMDLDTIFDLFAEDLTKYEQMVTRNVKVSLEQNEFDALVHFVYNVGEPNFKKSNLLKNLNAGNKKLAFDKGFHGFLKPPELRGRRDKERAIALNGNYGGTVATLFTATTAGKLKTKGTINLSNHNFGAKPTAALDPVVGPVDETPKVDVNFGSPTTKTDSTPSLIGSLLAIFAAWVKGK